MAKCYQYYVSSPSSSLSSLPVVRPHFLPCGRPWEHLGGKYRVEHKCFKRRLKVYRLSQLRKSAGRLFQIKTDECLKAQDAMTVRVLLLLSNRLFDDRSVRTGSWSLSKSYRYSGSFVWIVVKVIVALCKVVKYHHKPKRSSSKIRIFETEF